MIHCLRRATTLADWCSSGSIFLSYGWSSGQKSVMIGSIRIGSNRYGDDSMFLRDTWYVACTDDELTDRPLGRTICGEAIVFFRSGPGQVAALEDFCPHRGAPLSLGKVCDGRLVCGYHG